MKKLKVSVEVHGKMVPAGHITGDSTHNAVFSYNQEYIENGRPISVSLPLRKEPFSAAATRYFFEGLLPEGFTRKSVARSMQLDENDYLSILAGLGKECLGAIQITDESADGAGREPEEFSYKKLSLQEVKSLAAEGATRSAEIVVASHLSLTGASGKAGLYYRKEDRSWYQPYGTAPSTHIVKQSHVRYSNIVENEQLVLLTASKVGIPAAHSLIVKADPQEAPEDSVILLATKRYDRDLSHSIRSYNNLPVPLRLHQEDFAQALGIPAMKKYESDSPEDGGSKISYLARMFRLIRNVSADPIHDQIRLLDQLIFDTLIGNTDNHIKNYSLLYDPELKGIRLAPAYDLVSTLVYKTESPKAEMSIAIAGEMKWNQINRDTFAVAAPEVGIRQEVIVREYDRLRKQLPGALDEAAEELIHEGFPAAGQIRKQIRERCAV